MAPFECMNHLFISLNVHTLLYIDNNNNVALISACLNGSSSIRVLSICVLW